MQRNNHKCPLALTDAVLKNIFYNSKLIEFFLVVSFQQISKRVHATIAAEKDKKGENTMLGLRIALLRIEKGWSQAELARRIGVSASAVGMYEQGRREPSLGLLVRLALELSVTTDYLLMGTYGT